MKCWLTNFTASFCLGLCFTCPLFNGQLVLLTQFPYRSARGTFEFAAATFLHVGCPS